MGGMRRVEGDKRNQGMAFPEGMKEQGAWELLYSVRYLDFWRGFLMLL